MLRKKAKPNEIELHLDNGLTVKAPTEAWVLAVLDVMQKIPGALEHIIAYLQANETKVSDPPDLHTSDGRRVHLMQGSE